MIVFLMEMTTDTPSLTQFKKRVSLSFKRHGSRSLRVMRYGCYANDFQFNSYLNLADFRIFSLFFSGLRVTFTG